MHLKSLRIQGFRRLNDLTLSFKSGLNVIVGPNNAGKTAVVDALRVLLSASDEGNLRLTELDLHQAPFGERSQSATFTFVFSGLSDEHEADFITALIPVRSAVGNIVGYEAQFAQRPKRHYYSPELKGQIVAECQVSGASVAGVALAHGINANIVHRWMREQADSLLPAPRNEFVALNLPPPVEQLPATETSSPPVSRAIRVDVRRSASVVTVNWPLEDAASCAAWLRDWLR